MAIAQYQDVPNGINVSRTVIPPKKITNLFHWFKACRKVIKEIPEAAEEAPHPVTGWVIRDQSVDIHWIKFTLEDRNGYRTHLVINRRAGGLR